MNPRNIHISDYNYTLPPERIARYPLARRDQSKLLVYDKGKISRHVFKDIAGFIPENSLLVCNNTKVIQARLHFRKPTGALIEIFCLEPHSPNDYQLIFEQREHCEWQCLVGNKKKWKDGKLALHFSLDNNSVTLEAEITETAENHVVVRFSWNGNYSFAEILEAIGELPIPPYLNRDTEESDKETYQTVYSKIGGSVAAPTAGLHFTQEVFCSLEKRNIECEEVTLHVGAGTFKPVKATEINGHEMHSEYICVKRHTIERLVAHQGHCTAVGTTSVRTLESLFYIGLKIMRNPDIEPDQLHIEQWLPYDTPDTDNNTDPLQPLNAILTWLDSHNLNTIHTTTQIIIAPGYKYHIVERIITNFHMPQSTLLLLVSAFIGDDWKRVYDYALDNDFRFLSYGDSSILIPQQHND
ncbi:MAG: S-adenosylmethionine:tRNA ribosyltransferase-isomerase [Bacteroidaceae bacterium]